MHQILLLFYSRHCADIVPTFIYMSDFMSIEQLIFQYQKLSQKPFKAHFKVCNTGKILLTNKPFIVALPLPEL